MDALADSAAAGGFDENDPASMARFMKKMGEEMGEDLGEDVDEVVDEAMSGGAEGDAEAGEAPESESAGAASASDDL